MPDDISTQLRREWQALRDRYLPVRPRGSIWSFSRVSGEGDPTQGWKLHIAASVLSACSVFRRIAPFLRRRRIPFKAPRSLDELIKLNAGTAYGFSQVGKFVTVYPASAELAVELARTLDRLTRGQPAPPVPYDEVLGPGSCVHYRYGAFNARVRMRLGARLVPAVRRPDGTKVPDQREPGTAVPTWLDDPFRRGARPRDRSAPTPLETGYRGYQALVQRGRGGVYRALDVSSTPAESCIIKEGRRHGETDWHGRDGYHRVQNEARFLKSLSRVTKAVPRVRATFRARGSFYLVMDDVGGRLLQTVIASRGRLSRHRTLVLCRNMSRIVADIHSAGWTWADCKPANFICGGDGVLVALDFEGAFRTGDPVPLQTRTPGFVPPRPDAAHPPAGDLFALGACFAQLVTRKVHPPEPRLVAGRRGVWRGYPPALAVLTQQLLGPDPKSRPPAREVERQLEEMLSPRPHSRGRV